MRRDERRRYPRVDVAASAVVFVPGGRSPVRYVVRDLSVGGALLQGGPPLSTADVIQMVLYLEGSDPLVIDARLAPRKARDGSDRGFAVAFQNLNAVQEDVIQDAILSALELLNGPDSRVRTRDRDRESDRPAEPRRTKRDRVG